MKFYVKKQEPLSLNVTPLIDIVFLLLIFFMTSTTFTHHPALEITLPTLNAQKITPTEQTIRLDISAQGKYTLNNKPLQGNTMHALLQAFTASQPFNADTVILIAADASASYQEVMRAMDAAGQLGYTRIQLQGNFQSREHKR